MDLDGQYLFVIKGSLCTIVLFMIIEIVIVIVAK